MEGLVFSDVVPSSLNDPLPKILLIGDSLTQTSFEGWGSKISDVYQRRADVINRGCSGYNTKFYLHQLPHLEDLNNVCLVTIWFGANDASLQHLNPHHYVSVNEYQSNLKTIVQSVRQKYNSPKILLITPPPVQHEQRFLYQKQRYGDRATGVLERTLENAGIYATACNDIATELGVPCLNIYNVMMQTNDNDWGRFFWDGLHFSKEGHEFVAIEILNAIQIHFPELRITADNKTGQWNNSSTICQGLSSWGPYHDEIDITDIKKSFSLSIAPSLN